MIPADPDERGVLAGEYVLGLLDAAEAAAVEAALGFDPLLAADVSYWEERLAPLGATLAPVAPEAGLWDRIARDLGLAARPDGTRGPAGRLWQRLGFWRLAAVAGGIAVLALAWLFGPAARAPSVPAYVAVLQAQDRSAGWLVEVGADREVRLTALAASDPGPGRGLQLWTLIDRAQGPVSLGMVPARGALRFAARPTPAIGDGQLFEISLEPATGSPTGRPTGPVLFIGRAVAVGAGAR